MTLPRLSWHSGATLMVAVYALGVLPSLGQPLLESHAFRQTQTAYTALLYAEEGIDLLRPPLPVLGPPGILPLEFPLFQAGGAVLMEAGLAADTSMRVAALLCFLAAGLLSGLLARRLAGDVAGLVTLAAFLFNVHSWVYGRASLIEYMAAAGGVAFLLFALQWTETRRAHHWLLALAGGLVAILVKITTGGFYLIPALFLRGPSGRWGYQQPGVWSLLALVTGAGLAWSAYAGAVRSETPAADFLALENQLGWLFGTGGQRLDPGQWRVPVLSALMLTGSGLVLWAPLAVCGARQASQKAFAIAILATAAVVPAVLFNLYAVHDYYFAAIAPLIAIGLGLGARWLLDRRRNRWVRRAMVGLAGAWIATIVGLTGTWSLIYGTPAETERAMRIAQFIQSESAPDDWVILRGHGWNPSFLYYARRRGIAVPDHEGLQDTSSIDLESILADPRLGPAIACGQNGSCAVISGRGE